MSSGGSNETTTPLRGRTVVTGNNSASVSGMTTPNERSTRRRNQQENVVHDATAGLLNLRTASTPSNNNRNAQQSTRDALLEEERLETVDYEETPPPEDADSEDEIEDENNAEIQLAQLNRQMEDLAVIGEEQTSGNGPVLYGAPRNWLPPCAPDDFVVPARKVDLGEPQFEDLDNPGGWSSYTFRPYFVKEKGEPLKCTHHRLPTGATPVPKDEEGKRVVHLTKKVKVNRQVVEERTGESWEFHYDGWKNEGAHQFRD